MDFKERDQVDVCQYQGNLIKSWHPATMIEIKEGRFLVEYRNILLDVSRITFMGLPLEGETRHHQELVDPKLVRPSPPDFRWFTKFCIDETVDALRDGAWWIGRVAWVLQDSCIVCFKSLNKIIRFSSTQLRLHLDYFNGEWRHAIKPKNI